MKDVAGSQAIRNIFAHATDGQNDLGLKMTEGVLVEDYVRYQWHEQEDLNPTGQPFPDPERTIMTYDRDFGSGKGTLEAFMAEATAQEKDNWRRQYTAEALVEYFQTGIRHLAGKTNRTDDGCLHSGEGGDRCGGTTGGTGRPVTCPLTEMRSVSTAMKFTTAERSI